MEYKPLFPAMEGEQLIGLDSDSLWSKVRTMEKQYKAFRDLAGEMLATFKLPANKEVFDKLPLEFQIVLVSWIKKYEYIEKGR